jgi:hypothetical protein
MIWNKLSGYDFFSNLPTEVQEPLEARRTERFLNGVSLLADNTLISSEAFPFPSGGSINLSVWQDDSDRTLISDIRKISSSSEVSISKAIVFDNNIAQIGSSEGSFLETSITQIGSFEGGIIQVTTIKVHTIQDTIIKVGSTQVGILESSPIQVSPLETGFFQIGIVEHNIHQLSPSEISAYQNNSIQVQAGQVGATPINSSKISFSTLEPLTQFFLVHDSNPQSLYQLILPSKPSGVVAVVAGVVVKFDAAVNFSLLVSWLKPWFPRKPELTCSKSVLSMKYATYRSD